LTVILCITQDQSNSDIYEVYKYDKEWEKCITTHRIRNINGKQFDQFCVHRCLKILKNEFIEDLRVRYSKRLNHTDN